MCVFAYLHIQAPTKNHKAGLKIHKTLSEKNIPKCSFAYLRICFEGKKHTALSNFSILEQYKIDAKVLKKCSS